jgi:hypothetical protein
LRLFESHCERRFLTDHIDSQKVFAPIAIGENFLFSEITLTAGVVFHTRLWASTA